VRYIRENKQPEALIRYLALLPETGKNSDYSDVGQVELDGRMVSVKAEIRKARIADQGGICAYTMMRITEDSCHNEHLVPQSVSRQKEKVEETLDYRNIVACYPKREEAGGCEFGAPARRTKRLEVTPLDPACEKRIHFDRTTGRAEPAAENDNAIRELIENVLILNHSRLVARRLEACERFGVGLKCRNPLSERSARELAGRVLEHRRGSELTPFCIAVAQAAMAHANLIERRRRQHAPRN
jgi:uncharacterized protein (TIGR02646 family)